MVDVDVIVASVLWSLALLLLASGLAKVLTRRTDESALNVLALPAVINTRPVRTALPWIEMILAFTLLLSSGIVLWAATAATVVLFIGFTVFVTLGVRQGDPASCGCFGSLSRAPMSWRSVVRNLVFVALAVVAFVVTSTASFHGPVLALPWWSVVAAAVPLLVIGMIVWAERGSAGSRGSRAVPAGSIPPLPQHLPESTSSVAPGAPEHEETQHDDYVRLPIPYISAVTGDGDRVSVRTMARSRARALFYVSPGCSPCMTLLDRLQELPDALGPVALHTVVSHAGSLEALPASLRANALVDLDRSLASSFGMTSNPWAVVLGADGLLAGGPEAGGAAAGDLLDELVERFGTVPQR